MAEARVAGAGGLALWRGKFK